jgi:predicted transcriptional regulator
MQTHQTTTFRLPAALFAKLDQEAEARNRSRNFIIVELLEKHYASATTNGNTVPKKKAGSR